MIRTRIAILGAGVIGRRHVRTLARLPDVVRRTLDSGVPIRVNHAHAALTGSGGKVV
jgi:homoserine dehydrogenase